MTTAHKAYDPELSQLLTGVHGTLMCSIVTLETKSGGGPEAVSHALMGVATLVDRALDMVGQTGATTVEQEH